MTSRSITEWQDFIKNCIDFRPHDGVYRIARDMFTETELFDLEMEQIFEKVWIYACHERALLHKPICKGFFSDIIFK